MPARPTERGALMRVAVALLAALTVTAKADDLANDYPTEARADYVFACMAANGQTPENLRKCACSADVVASILPYDRYVEAETILAMRQGVGRQASFFRGATFEDEVADLRRAQAEGDMRCF